MSTISVIIPVYNGEKTIKETVESVLAQDFVDFELIIINDGSQDSTLDIVASISDPRIKVFSYSNAGLSASRNRGFGHSCGKYIAFLDADDLWAPDKLSKHLKILQEHPQAAVAYSWTNLIDKFGDFVRIGSRIAITGNVYPNLLLANFLESGSNALICRYALEAVGGFDESLSAAEDWDMWLRLSKHYDFVAVPYPHVLYRLSPHSMSTNVLRQETACLQVIEQAFSRAPASLQSLKRCSKSNLYKYLTYRVLEGYPKRSISFLAILYLLKAIEHSSDLLLFRISMKVIFKVILITVLPSKGAHFLITKHEKLFNTSSLLGHIQV
ncbi:MAG: glycosyltransferase [Trichocoleus desertorum ATA4-8-CV12]|jgi:glycosyltransferase involved in cell wall biosynthesis|nr:glycosyltransferase [Trichocoleus desertorum ATA4-8-CV12]